MQGISQGGTSAGVAGRNDNPKGAGVLGVSAQGIGVLARNEGGNAAGLFASSVNGDAGFFQGDVTIAGNLTMSLPTSVISFSGQDCAEHFDIADLRDIEPGTVMVITDAGTLRPSQQGYDKKVAGVISGAGDYKPGLILGKQESQDNNKTPLALVGKVYCKVDADYAPIDVGDLLTTSPRAGHAMKADDPLNAFGSVIVPGTTRERPV